MNEPARVIAQGTCWRCSLPTVAPNEGRKVALVHDPLMAPTDSIGICVTCATTRAVIKDRRDRR